MDANGYLQADLQRARGDAVAMKRDDVAELLDMAIEQLSTHHSSYRKLYLSLDFNVNEKEMTQ